MITLKIDDLKRRVERAQQEFHMDNKVYKPVWMYAIQNDTTPEAVIDAITAGALPGMQAGSRWFVEIVDNKESEK